MKAYPWRILLCGGSGTGKSTTINRICAKELAKADHSPDPVTSQFQLIRCSPQILLMDMPGIGDSPAKDKKRLQDIDVLFHKPGFSKPGCRIDRLVLITDINSRDLSSVFSVLKTLSGSGKPFRSRLIIGANQMDLCDPDLVRLRAESIRERIRTAFPCFKAVKVIPYSARTGENSDQLLACAVPYRYKKSLPSARITGSRKEIFEKI